MSYQRYFDTFDFVPIILASIIKEGQYKEDKTQSYVRDLLSRKIFDAEQLVARLENQTSETIDDFIFQNPDLAEITKISVATIIFKRLYAKDGKGDIYNLKQLDSRPVSYTHLTLPTICSV